MIAWLASRFPVIAKNLSDIRREKTFLLLMALLLFILISISILVATVALVYNPEYLVQEPMHIGTLDDSGLYNRLIRHSKVELHTYAAMTDAQIAFDESDIDAILYVSDQGPPVILNIVLPSDRVKSTVLLSIIKSVMEREEYELQEDRHVVRDAVWPSGIRYAGYGARGIDVLFEIIIGFMIPLIILIPGFVIGNMFIDNISQEFEEGNVDLIFSSASPLRYIHEYLLLGLIVNTVLVSLFLVVLFLRFSFLESFAEVLVYGTFFSLGVLLFSLLSVFLFQKKDIAQIVYSFGILTIFMLSPFFFLSPLQTLTGFLLGYGGAGLWGFAPVVVIVILLYGILRWYLGRLYYCR
jgi:hypothetical protein